MPNMVQVDAAEAKVRGAEISYQSAQAEAERFRQLYAQSLISQTEFNQYQLAAQLRKAELDAAESNRDLLIQGTSKKSTRVSNVVISTVEATVLELPVKVGTSVTEANTFSEGTTIASVADMSDMIFQGRVDESEVGKVREGMPVAIAVGALGTERFEGTLEYISPKGVEKDGTIEFEVKAALRLKDGVMIRANYSANADIILERRESRARDQRERGHLRQGAHVRGRGDEAAALRAPRDQARPLRRHRRRSAVRHRRPITPEEATRRPQPALISVNCRRVSRARIQSLMIGCSGLQRSSALELRQGALLASRPRRTLAPR